MNAEILSLNTRNGLMIYWDEVDEAANYYVHLLVGEKAYRRNNDNEYETSVVIKKSHEVFVDFKASTKEIALIQVERNIKYYTFKDLGIITKSYRVENILSVTVPDRFYCLYVEAENRQGEIIDSSNKIIAAL